MINDEQAKQNARANASEYRKVLAYQKGFNDRMAGRDKELGIGQTSIEYGAYLQGWNDAGPIMYRGKLL